jgi:hypothetical protein
MMTLAVGLPGCWLAKRVEYLGEKPPNPLKREGVEDVVVVAINATHNISLDVREVAEIYSAELQQFKDVNVFPAAPAEAAVVYHGLTLPEQADRLAALLEADAALIVVIDDYQPYDHPRVGVLLMLYKAAADTAPPGPNEPIVPAKALWSLKRVYDSDVKEVADQVRAFAVDRNAQKNPLGHREYLLVTSKYLHFVADRSIRDLFSVIRKSQEPESVDD